MARYVRPGLRGAGIWQRAPIATCHCAVKRNTLSAGRTRGLGYRAAANPGAYRRAVRRIPSACSPDTAFASSPVSAALERGSQRPAFGAEPLDLLLTSLRTYPSRGGVHEQSPYRARECRARAGRPNRT